MLKQKTIKVLVGLALLLAMAGSAGIVADGLGVAVAHACSVGSSSGGGC